jgi:hypothetical protein
MKQIARTASSTYLLVLFFVPEDGDNISSKHQLTFHRIHGFIFQEIVIFTNTALKTSNLYEEY